MKISQKNRFFLTKHELNMNF